MKMKNENNLLGGIAFVFILLILLMLLGACKSTEKAVRKAVQTLEETDRLDDVCAEKFPVKESVIYKPGKPIYTSDTTYLPGDSIPCPPGGKDTVFLKCPPTPVIHDSVKVHDTLYIRQIDSAALAAMRDKLRRKTKDSIENAVLLRQYKEKAHNRGRTIWTAIIVIALAGGVWLYFTGKFSFFKSIFKR